MKMLSSKNSQKDPPPPGNNETRRRVGKRGPVELDTESRRLDVTLHVGASPNFLPNGRDKKERQNSWVVTSPISECL